jgi:hypothetical protein
MMRLVLRPREDEGFLSESSSRFRWFRLEMTYHWSVTVTIGCRLRVLQCSGVAVPQRGEHAGWVPASRCQFSARELMGGRGASATHGHGVRAE